MKSTSWTTSKSTRWATSTEMILSTLMTSLILKTTMPQTSVTMKRSWRNSTSQLIIARWGVSSATMEITMIQRTWPPQMAKPPSFLTPSHLLSGILKILLSWTSSRQQLRKRSSRQRGQARFSSKRQLPGLSLCSISHLEILFTRLCNTITQKGREIMLLLTRQEVEIIAILQVVCFPRFSSSQAIQVINSPQCRWVLLERASLRKWS